MKAKFINESIFQPKSEEDILNYLNSLSYKEKADKLHDFIHKDDYKMIKLLLSIDNGYVDYRQSVMTPLMIAANYGYMKTVQLLLDNGADPNKMTPNYRKASSFARQGGYWWIEELLKTYENKK